jgi:hypothetical protein
METRTHFNCLPPSSFDGDLQVEASYQKDETSFTYVREKHNRPHQELV